MFGIGMPELLIILVVALIVVGPRKLPDLARSLGKGMQEFRKATDEIKNELTGNETFQEFQEVHTTVKETVAAMKPQNLLDTDSLLEPKKPKEDHSGREKVLKEITEAASQEEQEEQPVPDDQAGSHPPESDSQTTQRDAKASSDDA
jgi:sec-independent protein translocase protein TatB